MDLREERELAFQRLLRICQSGLVSITDFRSAINHFSQFLHVAHTAGPKGLLSMQS